MGFFQTIWHDIVSYFMNGKIWENFADHAISIIFIVIGTFVTVKVGRAALHRMFKARQGSRIKMTEKEKRRSKGSLKTLFLMSFILFRF